MNEYFQENKRSIFLLITALLLLAIVLYMLLLRPLQSDLSSKEKDIIRVKEEIELLQAHLDSDEPDRSALDIEQIMLEKKIPEERNLDEYILSLQQLEFKTNSSIDHIQFVYDSNLEIKEDEDNEEQEKTTNTDEQSETNAPETEDANKTEPEVDQKLPTIDPELLKEIPENLHIITVRVVATSPTYSDFIELLEVIEDTERISIVTGLTFTQPTENDEYFVEDYDWGISFIAELTTFYYVD